MINVLLTSILDLFWDLQSLPLLYINLTKPPNFYHHYTSGGIGSGTILVYFNFQFQF